MITPQERDRILAAVSDRAERNEVRMILLAARDRAYFFENVKEMRRLQVEYFKTRDRGVLERCKALEQSVDEALAGGQANLF